MQIRIESKIDMPLHIKNGIISLLKSIYDKDLDVTISRHKKKRSLDSNAYYWTLVGKLAKITGSSKARQHNLLLRDYGTDFIIDGRQMITWIPETEEAAVKALESAEYHLRPTSKSQEGYRQYIIVKGSSYYDSSEMAQLIAGTITECRECEMSESEIMTPFEKQQLKERYGIDFG